VRGLAAALLWLGSWSCGGDEACSAEDLALALESARPGDTVRVGACRIDGAFTVPAGIAIDGVSQEESIIASAATALMLEGDATISDLHLVSASDHGISGTAAADVVVRSVKVEVEKGRSAIGIVGARSVVIADVELIGPVTQENAAQIDFPATATTTALFGLLLRGVGDASLERVRALGFAEAGVVSSESALTWRKGSASENLGIGVWIDAGSAVLEDVTIDGTRVGARPVPTFGLATGRSASLETARLAIASTEGGFGAFHDGGSISHREPTADGNAAGAIFGQRTASLAIRGGTFRDNEFGGILGVEAGGLSIEDTTVEGTVLVSRAPEGFGVIRVGDGVHLVSPVEGTAVRRTTLRRNGRAGLLLDLGGASTDRVALEDVSATADGSAFGVVVQNGTAIDGWDGSVTRAGAATANDDAFPGDLDVVAAISSGVLDPVAIVGAIGPCE
jgi:hypothetical protein